ncbi:MAG: Nicotinate-nucleotide adenylyltransferase [Anaerolineales bacterium]|nr:Nicotinate-nucleotide adenylyltransferase [Anaerolineales bacterium]
MIMKVGVLGGTFDPPHIAHLIAAEEARVQLSLERVFFMPAGTPPHKLGEHITVSEHRVEMVRRAVASNPHFCVSLVDVERSGPSYTVETLHLLRERWGAGTEIYFIVGMDMLADLSNWRQPREVVSLCRLAVVDRPGFDISREELESILPGISRNVESVSMPLLNVSSTGLRRRVREGRTIRYYVPADVEAYIQAHSLYR